MEKSSFQVSDEPLLDLSTLTKRPCIVIDGARYEILSPNEISVMESHRFGIWGNRIEELAPVTGEPAGKELTDLIDTAARAVGIGVPDEIFATLSGSHKWAIVDVFFGLLLRSRLGVVGAIAKATGVPWTGEKLFPGSSASTAECPDGGWLKRLSRWFTRT